MTSSLRFRAALLASLLITLCTIVARADETPRQPLAPLDTSSPRTMLRGFRDTLDRIAERIATPANDASLRTETRHWISQVLSCLDLTHVAPTLADSMGREAAVCLKEVLDRIEVPDDAAIPGPDEVAATKLTRWRLPGTEITLVRVADGHREGEFVFSAETVAHARLFFDRVRGLPYKPSASSPGLHEAYETMGGWMIPRELIQGLPAWARTAIGGETVWQWLATAFLVACAVGSALVALRLSRWAAGRSGVASLAVFTFPATVIGGGFLLDFFLTFQVRLTGTSLLAAKVGVRLVLLVGIIGGVLAILRRVTDFLIHARGLRPDTIDSQLIRLASRVASFAAVAWIMIHTAESLGISIAPLVAGLGVGGLAIALAAQHTTENLIAGIVLFTDKPVRIGEECEFGAIRGRVEQIGLRSTRIRRSDRTLVSVPNAEFVKLQLINHTRRDHVTLKTIINLCYGTTPEQLRTVMDRIRQTLLAHPRIANEPARVRFVAFGPHSLDVEILAFVLTNEWSDFLAVQEEVLLQIMAVVQECGCDFAFPTQTVHLQADSLALPAVDTGNLKLPRAA